MEKEGVKVQKNITTIGVVGTSNITEKFISVVEHTDVTAHQQVSLDSIRLMDEVRRQQDLRFPVE